MIARRVPTGLTSFAQGGAMVRGSSVKNPKPREGDQA